MPRYAKKTENRWLHPLYRTAYVFNRNGEAYTCVNSIRKATRLAFSESNRYKVMKILNQRIDTANNASLAAQWSVSNETITDIRGLINDFHKNILSKQCDTTQAHYRVIYRQFFPQNLKLQTKILRTQLVRVLGAMTEASPNTIYKKIQRLNKMFDYAVELNRCIHQKVIDVLLSVLIRILI